MKKTYKSLLAIGTIGAVVGPIAAVVACGDTKDEKITKENSWFVTDGGSIKDKSFNQSVLAGFNDAFGSSLGDSKQAKQPTSKTEIASAYGGVKTRGGKLIVGAGYTHGVPMKAFAKANTSMKFVIVDSDLHELPNVASILFNVEQVAFIAGVLGAAEAVKMDANTPKIGYYGGKDFASVTSFSKGLVAGIKFYNANKPSGKSVELDNRGFVGNFASGGQSKVKADALVASGCELILAVGGPQYKDVLAAIGTKTTSKLIGVDTNIAQIEAAQSSHIWGSIMKGLKQATKDVVTHLLNGNTNDLGKVYHGNIENNGVSFALGSTVQTKAHKYGLTDTVLKGKTADQIIAAAKAFTV